MKTISLIRALGTASLVFVAACATADTAYREIPISEFADAIKHWNDRTGETDAAHYALTQIPQIADNILRYQRADGGWPSNKHPIRILSTAEQKDLAAQQHLTDASFDNRNVYPQINYLARAYQQTGDSRYRDGALRGIDYILKNQYKNGGWPHTPASTKATYHQHITFADDVMTGLLQFLRDVTNSQSHFAFISPETLADIRSAIHKGDQLILQLQISIDGKPTVWAGQYDKNTLAPVGARSFELPALLAWESVAVVDYLMRIEDPTDDIKNAVHAAAAWFDQAKIEGLTLQKISHPRTRYPYHTADYDLKIIRDQNAEPLWARFYDLKTQQPFFANRDGKKVFSLEEVNHERRTGYSWYGSWPSTLLSTRYPAWRARNTL
ncbi:pectate lyase [Cellvibrio sp. ARAG 10.3]|uniref:pectate lyase n=1 Tax=Cellvibrio sp. ARAG 10.3 TaxID=3451358 RepID=UPI003F448D51